MKRGPGHLPPCDPFVGLLVAALAVAVIGSLWANAVHVALTSEYCR